MWTTPMPVTCPVCGQEFSMAGFAGEGIPPRDPEDGDPALCSYCGAILVLTEETTAMRIAEPWDLEGLSEHDRKDILEQSKKIMAEREGQA